MHRNIRLYYLIIFLTNSAFTLPIWVIFGTNYLHLSYLQTTFLGTFSYLISTIFDVPTGALADRYGRKIIHNTGLFLSFLGIVFFIIFKDFNILLLGQFLNGLGLAFQSSCLESLIYDQLLETDKKDKYIGITSTGAASVFYGRGIAAIFGGFLFAINPVLPYFLFAIVYFISIVTALFLVEKRDKNKKDDLTTYKRILQSLKYLIAHKELRSFLIFLIVYVFFGNILFIIYQPFLVKLGFTPPAIGLVYVLVSIFSAVGANLSKKILTKFPITSSSSIMLAGVLITAILMLFLNPFFGLVAIACLSFMFGLQGPIEQTYSNERIPSNIRSTSLSAISLGDSLAFILCSWITGLILDKSDLNSVLLFVLISIVIFLFIWIFILSRNLKRKDKNY